MARNRQRARLEADVVQAAMAERRAGLRLLEGHNFETTPEAEKAWNVALDAYEDAVDA